MSHNSNLKKQIPKDEVLSFDIYALSYKLLSKKLEFLFPRLGSLQTKILRSGSPIYYEAFVCGIVFVSILASMIGVIIGIIFSALVTLDPPALEFIMPFIVGGL